jgi:hypothetical protein
MELKLHLKTEDVKIHQLKNRLRNKPGECEMLSRKELELIRKQRRKK